MSDEDRDAAESAARAPAVTGPTDPLDLDDLRRRAAGGAASLGARSLFVLGFAVVGNVVLARLLEPGDFGLVALGTTLLVAGNLISAGGLGVGLVGRPRPPSRRELEALNAFQLVTSGVLVVGFAACAWPFGREGLVPALMLLALPFIVLRAPQAIVLERDLAFRAIATVDIVEVIVQYVWAIGTVAAGAGVWGFASAGIVRSVIGTAVMVRIGGLGFVRPRWSWRDVRPLIGFGVKFQAPPLIDTVRDQGLNLGIVAISGIGTLGIWSLALRIGQVPMAALVNLYRVSYPAMAKLVAAGQDPRAAMERAAALTATAIGVAVVGIVAGAPALVPTILGERWEDVTWVLVAQFSGLVIGGPMYAGAVGWLYSVGRPEVVVRASLYGAVTLLVTALALLPLIGVVAVGVGWLAAALVSRSFIARVAHRETGARFWRSAAIPGALTFAAAAVGLVISSAGEPRLEVGLLAAVGSELLLLGGLAVLQPELLRASRRLLAQGLREAQPRRGWTGG